MWTDYNHNGMSDFMCTNAVQYMIRDGQLVAVVQMRSNDVVFGYRNDYAWQKYVADMLTRDLGLDVEPKIIWNVGNLHVYERHFDKVK
jgi:thymidylate synthase